MDGARILLVEDDERLAQLVSDALTKAGWQVTHAARGDHGEALMRRERFDVVLLDGQLPGKDGFDVGRHAHRVVPRELPVRHGISPRRVAQRAAASSVATSAATDASATRPTTTSQRAAAASARARAIASTAAGLGSSRSNSPSISA